MIATRAFAILGGLLAVGLLLFGWQMGRAVKTGRGFDRYFTVRGLSEREVKATLVIWPLTFKVAAEDLPALKSQLEAAKATVAEYLAKSGIATSNIRFGLPKITDRLGQRYSDAPLKLPRYEAVSSMVVRSVDVDLVKKAILGSEELIAKGVPLIREDYGHGIDFIFDGVNDVKPAMIKEATANARLAANKFAEDSKARVGAIRRATQGVVEIQDLDAATPETKLVRVVTTVEFFIE